MCLPCYFAGELDGPCGVSGNKELAGWSSGVGGIASPWRCRAEFSFSWQMYSMIFPSGIMLAVNVTVKGFE